MNSDFARQQMVEQQVRAWEVLDPDVLEVLKQVPRERFVPAAYATLAFADTEIPIGHGQVMMTPTIEGRILQALTPRSDDDVLEVGTGTGFLAACLASLSGSVTSVDIFADFLDSAAANLEVAGIGNVELFEMDATRTLPDDRFDAIAVTGSVEDFDPRFVMALKPGGRLFIVVGRYPVMEARLVTRTGDNEWQSESLFETALTPLVNGALPPQFSF
jgi:protein-L-isoaspartate(D-aspartate) O-methyltransferase